ncbi:hypothetical protein J2X65_003518 [Ancylobacter sp. 3268]|uniref:hypothetical protein n=1 Tax=Ancylobacter sp. 3268 TaxID=2817752 RepID=UPI0028591C8D|nr:hypothetical protein [Ancylobacter sp. 3268]MDR6954150.1 hypothetical protein [Ancylobacter sp. 3268]
MIGDLFREALPHRLAPDHPVHLVGPYARQTLHGFRLKFWFAMTGHKDGTRRYELAFDVGDPKGRHRYRGSGEPGDYREHTLPGDLSLYPSMPFPAHGQRIEDALTSMLTGDDLADVVRLTRFGIMPARCIIEEG